MFSTCTDSIVKMPATSSRKPNFADVKVVVIEDSPAHKVLKMVCESEEPMRLRTGEGGHDHGTWQIKGSTGRSRSSKVTLTLIFCG